MNRKKWLYIVLLLLLLFFPGPIWKNPLSITRYLAVAIVWAAAAKTETGW